METLKDLWNNACLSADIPAISIDTCARVFAILYVHGNNEAFVHNKSFLSDVRYIQERFGISGGETPDSDFSELTKEYIKDLEDYEDEHKNDKRKSEALFHSPKPEWAVKLFKSRYDIDLLN